MPNSLLTAMASDLQVSEGIVGQAIAICGMFAALTNVSITTLAGALNCKTLLRGLTALMGISGALVALAPDYLILPVLGTEGFFLGTLSSDGSSGRGRTALWLLSLP